MRLQEMAWREAWMTDDERLIMKRFIAAIRRFFQGVGVPDSPLLQLRVIDVGVHCLLTRRLERALAPTVRENGEVVLDITGPLADHVGKTRERLRKAIRELEDACARMGTPVDTGIADTMLSVVRETRDLLHGEIGEETQ